MRLLFFSILVSYIIKGNEKPVVLIFQSGNAVIFFYSLLLYFLCITIIYLRALFCFSSWVLDQARFSLKQGASLTFESSSDYDTFVQSFAV
jgi:hypothetical protein